MLKNSIIRPYHFLILGALILSYFFSIGKSDSYIKDRVVKLKADHGMCSGEQVRAPSGVDYILTAAHCRVLKDGDSISVVTEDGKVLPRRIIAEDDRSDLLLLEGIPGVRGLDIASFSFPTQKVRTFTHGHNFSTYQTQGELIEYQEVNVIAFIIDSPEDEMRCKGAKYQALQLTDIFGEIKACIMSTIDMATTAKIVPGSSGGPVVNSSGDIVGVVSAGDSVGFGYLVTTSDINKFLHNY